MNEIGMELAVVIVTSVLGLCGIVIAALVTRSKGNPWDGRERRETTLCAEHSGIVESLKNIEMLLTELRMDRMDFQREISTLVEAVNSLKASVSMLSHRIDAQEAARNE